MKTKIITLIAILFCLVSISLHGQDEQGKTAKPDKPVRNTFEDGGIINNQSVEVLRKKGLEFEIRHRLGNIKKSIEESSNFDFFGVFAPANIKIGLNYGVTDRLTVGIGGVKNNTSYYGQAKYKFLRQTKSGSMPLTLVVFVNAEKNIAIDDKYENISQRLDYFAQLLIARKFSKKFSMQLAVGFTHFNLVNDDQTKLVSDGIQIRDEHENISVCGDIKYKFSSQSSVLLEYSHPLIKSDLYERFPDLGIAYELSTGDHAFQIVICTASGLSHQQVTSYNSNDYNFGEFVIGFNLTRRWGF